MIHQRENFDNRIWQLNLKRKKEASELGEPNKKVRRELSTNVDIYEVHDKKRKKNIPNLTPFKISVRKNNEVESLTQKLEDDSAQCRQTAKKLSSNSNISNAQLSPNESKSLDISSTYSAGMKVVEMKDNREWEQILRPQTVRGGLIFCMLSFVHSALTYHFHDVQAQSGYALLGCISFGMAMYAKYAKTAHAFQRKLGIMLLMFVATRLISVAFFVDCTNNTIGSTCTQLKQHKYPMRWAMDSVACLTLASNLPSFNFRLLVLMEFLWTLIGIFEVNPKTLADQGMVCEVMFGLLLLFLCTDSQLRSNERMKKQIACRERTDRIVNHRIKNILADTYSTLLLYPQGLANLQDLERSAISVQRASRSIQNSLNLSQLLNPEVHDISPKTAQSNSREVKLGTWIREHGPSHASMHVVARGCDIEQIFVIQEILAAELFLDLALDNASLHGRGGTRVNCHFDGQSIIIDVNNRIGDEDETPRPPQKRDVLQHREFSTCLGNHDLILVCSKRHIPFECGARADDGRWHTSIKVSAAPVSSKEELATKSADSPKLLPRNLRIAVLDDIRMIVRLCTTQLQKKLQAKVEGYHIDTLKAFTEFADVTIPKNKCGWDIVILDQHLGLKCGTMKRGTELMDLLRDSGACLIMHSGNNDARDCEAYATHGCHGVVGKGDVFVEKVSKIYLEYRRVSGYV